MDGITLVLSLLPALFETVVDMSEALKVDAERRKAWTDLATHIAPYPTGVLPNTTTEIFIDYDQCDRLQDGAQNCLWSVHMPLFPLGTVGLNSSTRDRTLATASVAAWCPPLPPPRTRTRASQDPGASHACDCASEQGEIPELADAGLGAAVCGGCAHRIQRHGHAGRDGICAVAAGRWLHYVCVFCDARVC